jgi:hypothetical protein
MGELPCGGRSGDVCNAPGLSKGFSAENADYSPDNN